MPQPNPWYELVHKAQSNSSALLELTASTVITPPLSPCLRLYFRFDASVYEDVLKEGIQRETARNGRRKIAEIFQRLEKAADTIVRKELGFLRPITAPGKIELWLDEIAFLHAISFDLEVRDWAARLGFSVTTDLRLL